MSEIQSETDLTFVRADMLDELPAPAGETGAIGWVRKNLLGTWYDILFTILALWIVWAVIPPLIEFALVEGVWEGTSRAACATVEQGGEREAGWFGACWAYVGAYSNQFIYGRYPDAQQWRVNIVFIMLAAGLIPLLISNAPYKRANIIFMALVFPVLSFLLLTGGEVELNGFLLPQFIIKEGITKFWLDYLLLFAILAGLVFLVARGTAGNPRPMLKSLAILMAVGAVIFFLFGADLGLRHVDTDRWGGLLVTLIIAISGIAASLPLGILLALGRRSTMPMVRMISIIFIEFWRGVPLITVLFMSSVMLPLFLPEGVTFDKLLRALIGVALFASAYMAEVIRGGLQAIHKGQYEGAMALGLSYWQMMGKIILPQALKLVIPGIVNTFIGLFKDTTLVLIIGLFDFLGQIQSSFTDPNWSTPVQSLTAYLFAALVYFCFCFAMSRYSMYMERRLDTGH